MRSESNSTNKVTVILRAFALFGIIATLLIFLLLVTNTEKNSLNYIFTGQHSIERRDEGDPKD